MTIYQHWNSKISAQMNQLTPTPDWECGICLDGKDTREIVVHDCNKHWFHKECLDEARRHSHKCPICRFTIKSDIVGILFIPMYRDDRWHDLHAWLDNFYDSLVVNVRLLIVVIF